jgi:UDP-N-acetylmuramyl pentapeptide phosphotransferase/UDP-N-acetylglucosamine-1-phosphate transferase
VVSVGIYLPLAAFHLLRFSGEVFVLSSLSGALLGFYLFNNPTRPQGEKTFMGDSGSQFVGFVLAIMTLRLADAGSRAFTFGAALILLSPFLWDVSYTLVRRLVRGENILQAHRSHLYQRLLIAGWSHGQTLAVNFVLWGICYALSQTYARGLRFKGPVLPVVAVSATLLVLLAYTLMVLLVERSARKADQARK